MVEVGHVRLLDSVRFADDPEWEAWVRLWHAVRTKLSFEPFWFSDDALTELEAAAKRMMTVLPQGDPYVAEIPHLRPVVGQAQRIEERLDSLKETIARVRYLRLKNQVLVAYLPEVDVDRKLLIGRLQALGFSKELEAALNEVDH